MDPAVLARIALLTAILAVSNPNPVSVPTTGGTYIVQAGDTLYSIAVKFNTTVQALQQANNLADPNALVAGQKLKIPATTTVEEQPAPTAVARGPTANQALKPTSYTVKPGDTLATIAAQFGVTVQELAQANNIQDVNLLAVGQVLVIPQSLPPSPLPEGIALAPTLLKQGETLTLKITASDAVSATGKFDEQALHFIAEPDGLRALFGITRCANYAGTFPVALTLYDAEGHTRPVAFKVRVTPNNWPIFNLTLTSEMSSLLDPAIVNAENKRVADTVAPFIPQQLWRGAFRSPLAIADPRITATFGERRRYNGGNPGVCGHEGTDFGVPPGTPVYAPADAVVALASPLKVRGNVVLLNHGQGVYSGFYHLSEIDAQTGQRIHAGDLIGKVGSTGFSTGAHLHWSMWINGVCVDPLAWTKEAMGD